MSLAYVLIVFIFTILILAAFVISTGLDDLNERLKILETQINSKTQMDINESLLKQQDRMLSRIGDLNTRVIELEARIPEPVYISTDTDGDTPNLFPDIEDEDIVI